MSTPVPVQAVATSLNTCRASRARRDRAVLSDKRDKSRDVTSQLFPMPKFMG